jgi:cytosine/adenosine deaminase-related metal-dependent hydrolase
MRIISADYIFPIISEPVKNGAVVIDADGTIVDVLKMLDITKAEQQYNVKAEIYKGIICPGFINTHCHLELSHMRGQIAEGLGMMGFIKAILSQRSNASQQIIQEAIVAAENEMIKNGIVAVGDISNDNSTFGQKSKNKLHYHTFIEVFDLNPEKAEEAFNKGIELEQKLITIYPRAHYSIVPHAPYTVSEGLLKSVVQYAAKNESILSIHNQESATENELFISQTGEMHDSFKAMGINTSLLRTTVGVGNSLHSTLPFLSRSKKLLLVHNTFTSREDIQWAKKLMENGKWEIETGLKSGLTSLSKGDYERISQHLYWCTCPNANLYIENTLPDYNYFVEENVPVTIGTDSLASNWSLSVLDELKTISKYYPEISLQTLLLWATKNGADFLGLEELGTIEKGKRPGLNLLTNVVNLELTMETEVQSLIHL